MEQNIFRFVLSTKLQPTVLVVPHSPTTSRLFNFAKWSADGSVGYYSCKRCSNLSRKSVPNDEVYSVSVRVVNGEELVVEGGEHHPDCVPLGNEVIEAQQIDRCCRLLVRQGDMEPRQAFEQAQKEALERNVACFVGDWEQLASSYRRAKPSSSRKRVLANTGNDNKQGEEPEAKKTIMVADQVKASTSATSVNEYSGNAKENARDLPDHVAANDHNASSVQMPDWMRLLLQSISTQCKKR